MNEAKLTGFIKRILVPKNPNNKPTIDFIITCKNFGSDNLNDIQVSADKERFNDVIKESIWVDVKGIIKTDSWPLDKEGKWVKDAIKGEDGKVSDKRVVKWDSKTYVSASSIKEVSKLEYKNRIDAAKEILSGSANI
jgi:hypothetical protein